MCVSHRCASFEASRDDDEDEARCDRGATVRGRIAPSPTFRAIFRYGFTCVCMYCVSEYIYLQRPLGIESRARATSVDAHRASGAREW